MEDNEKLTKMWKLRRIKSTSLDFRYGVISRIKNRYKMSKETTDLKISLQVQVRLLKALQAIKILQGLDLAGTINLKPIKQNEAKPRN